MVKSGSKKTRLNQLAFHKRNEKICDVTLSDYADSVVPIGKDRLRKSHNVFSRVRQISKSEDIEDSKELEEDLDEESTTESTEAAVENQKGNEDKDQFTDYPLKMWFLLAEYIRPEDVKSFSLICKNSLSVVNTPLFWIRLYKRYYRKINIPKCLSCQCLAIRKNLKQKVVRALYYFHAPYALSVINSSLLSNDTLVGTLCLYHRIQAFEEKESNEGVRWLYTFKLSRTDFTQGDKQKRSQFYNSNDINYNPDDKCRLLKVICKEFIVMPSVRGMRLRKVECNSKTTTLKFSSAPLSSINSDLGTVTLHFDHTQKPLIVPWWHPDYWDHTKCCNIQTFKKYISY